MGVIEMEQFVNDVGMYQYTGHQVNGSKPEHEVVSHYLVLFIPVYNDHQRVAHYAHDLHYNHEYYHWNHRCSKTYVNGLHKVQHQALISIH